MASTNRPLSTLRVRLLDFTRGTARWITEHEAAKLTSDQDARGVRMTYKGAATPPTHKRPAR